MPPNTILTDSASATESVGGVLAPLLRAGDVLVLSGDLGAGKTQLTKGIARGLGVAEPVTSPTFNILLVHEGRIPLYHFDLYRLETARQLDDVDYWATLEADGVSVVEWGDRFAEAVPPGALVVRLHLIDDESRTLQMSADRGRGAQIESEWLAACRGLAGVVVEEADGL
jgi:tRNA threonylcarbamoyladenosine biosynthesis protein TsaE